MYNFILLTLANNLYNLTNVFEIYKYLENIQSFWNLTTVFETTKHLKGSKAFSRFQKIYRTTRCKISKHLRDSKRIVGSSQLFL
jgi:hypothetical protein